MANHEQEVMGDEEELFYSGLDGEARSADPRVEVEPEAVAEPVQSTRERDERGRFAAKSSAEEQPAEAEPPKQVETSVEAAAQEPAATQPPAKEDDGAQIPSWRMREIREARDAERVAKEAERARADRAEQDARQAVAAAQQLQQHLANMQRQMQQLHNPPKQTEPIDLFGDNGPERLLGTVEERFAQQQAAFQRELRNVRLESNFAMTHQLNPDVFPVAYQAFEQAINSGDRVVGARVFNSANPGAALVAWHKEQTAIKEIGGDVNAYRQRIIEEAKKDPAILAQFLEAARATASGQPAPTGQPSPRPNTVTQLPPSLRSVPGTAASADGAGTQNLSEEELFYSNLRR